MSRFLEARDGAHAAFAAESNKEWKGPFFFAQLADTQLGMLTYMRRSNPADWTEEVEMMKAAIAHINRLKPRFVIVCGDLVNAYPTGPTAQLQEQQVADFKKYMATIDETIPLVCVCGNHDIGDRPTAATIELYRSRFGDDHLTFWVDGVRCIVLNTQLYKDGADAAPLAAAQDAWLTEQLALQPAPMTLVFSHISPFINAPDEPAGYFNLEPTVRASILSRMKAGGVRGWFCGHYHRNAGGHDGPIEVVTSSAVGTTLLPSGTDPLGLDGFTGPAIGLDASGLRLVKVHRDALFHHWFSLVSVPDSVDPATSTW